VGVWDSAAALEALRVGQRVRLHLDGDHVVSGDHGQAQHPGLPLREDVWRNTGEMMEGEGIDSIDSHTRTMGDAEYILEMARSIYPSLASASGWTLPLVMSLIALIFKWLVQSCGLANVSVVIQTSSLCSHDAIVDHYIYI